jgi:hypothetical protein
MVMLNAFGHTTKRYSGNDRRSIRYVPPTDPLTRAIAAGKLEVTRCFQLPYQGIHPCLGDPGGLGSAPAHLVSPFVPHHPVWCHRYLIHRTASKAGTPVKCYSVWSTISPGERALGRRQDVASRRAPAGSQEKPAQYDECGLLVSGSCLAAAQLTRTHPLIPICCMKVTRS